MRDGEKVSRKRARFLRRTMTKAEVILWTRLRGKQLGGHKFRRQHPIGPYIADFACTSQQIVLEVDGWTHSSDAEREHDQRRTEFMAELGWTVIRVENDDVYSEEDRTLNYILARMAEKGDKNGTF